MYACLQVPWRALQSRPVVVEMSDVWLCASPRKEEEWEEDMASQRAQAAKQVPHLLPDSNADGSSFRTVVPQAALVPSPFMQLFPMQACS